MFVRKRDGSEQKVMFDKITARISKLSYELDKDHIDCALIAQKVCSGVYRGVETSKLDELAAETAANLAADHPDYGLLAARIAISNLHKNTKKSFVATMKDLRDYIEPKTKKSAPLISEEMWNFVKGNAESLDSHIIYARDNDFDYFGFKTLERSYLLKLDGKIVERPQHLLMRVSCGLHIGNLEAALETYTYMSKRYFTHASPTLFNSGTPRPQLSSCFLLNIKDDSIEGIYDTIKDTALISKSAGGIGVSVSKIRASGTYISGTNGSSNGLIPMLRVFNNTARYVDQGGGKRKGAFSIYLEPWHADIFDYLNLKKNHGSEELRARDLFYALWVPDLFMKRVRDNKPWSLFCPHQCPGLNTSWGEEFEKKYEQYEKEGKAKQVVQAVDLWKAILSAEIETGNPSFLFKDACNAKSNQKNLGTIQGSNLCTEIIQYSSPEEVAVCNLASIALPLFVDEKAKTFDFKKLFDVTRVVTRNLNRIIDINYYPIPEAKYSNLRNRPIAIGVQGLADAFVLLGLPYECSEARILNKDIFETIYFAALTESHELAKKDGPYPTYAGSPISQGLFQFDLWGVKPDSKRWDWDALRKSILKDGVGVRNSLVTAVMPTASTSQILGFNECTEAYNYNLSVRRTLAGEFVVVSKLLLKELVKLKIWDNALKQKIILRKGSVQGIEEIPAYLQELFKTVWEMKNKTLVNMSAERGAFIDQSQSYNVFMKTPTQQTLSNLHFYCWKMGLKTGLYYLRTQAATEAIQFTVDKKLAASAPAPAHVPVLPPPPSPLSASPIPSFASTQNRLTVTSKGEEREWKDGKKEKEDKKALAETRTTKQLFSSSSSFSSFFSSSSPSLSPFNAFARVAPGEKTELDMDKMDKMDKSGKSGKSDKSDTSETERERALDVIVPSRSVSDLSEASSPSTPSPKESQREAFQEEVSTLSPSARDSAKDLDTSDVVTTSYECHSCSG